jgi:hypothetical protein
MKRTTTLLAILTSATLFLTACAQAPTEAPRPSSDVSTEGIDTGGSSNEDAGEPPATGDADQATQDYLDCLIENGVDAIIDGDGNIALGAGESGTISSGSATSAPDSAQAKCQEAVPEYTAPNFSER